MTLCQKEVLPKQYIKEQFTAKMCESFNQTMSSFYEFIPEAHKITGQISKHYGVSNYFSHTLKTLK